MYLQLYFRTNQKNTLQKHTAPLRYCSKYFRHLRQGWKQVPRKAPNTLQERSLTVTMGLRSTADSPPGRPDEMINFWYWVSLTNALFLRL